MSLKMWWDTHREYSGLASSAARQIAFAGVAIVWVLANNEPGRFELPNNLLWPSLFFVIALACDFLQYFVASIIWHIFAKYKEGKLGVDYEGNDSHPDRLNWPAYLFFYAKCLSVITGYLLLAIYIVAAIRIS